MLIERALASLGTPSSGIQPRAAHLSLFPHVDLEEGTRVAEMAARLGITKQAVGQSSDELVDVGAIQSLEPQLKEVLGKRLLVRFREALLKLHDSLDDV